MWRPTHATGGARMAGCSIKLVGALASRAAALHAALLPLCGPWWLATPCAAAGG